VVGVSAINTGASCFSVALARGCTRISNICAKSSSNADDDLEHAVRNSPLWNQY
jgi:hypothetical protein